MASFFGFARGQFPNTLLARGAGKSQAAGAAARSALAHHDMDRSGGSGGAQPSDLANLVEAEIIPRIVAGAPGSALSGLATDPVMHGPVIEADQLDQFVRLAHLAEADVLLNHVEALIDGGVSVESVLVDLLAPTARALGTMWENDDCDFVEVTMGVWRLQQVAHEVTARHLPLGGARSVSKRILLAAMPDDQHGFALVLLEHMFELAGWDVDRMPAGDTQTIARCVAQDWYDVIGLTVSRDCHMAPLPSVIAALRSVSRNPRLSVLVGGRLFADDPGLAAKVGADGTAPDARRAVILAEALLASVDRAAI